MSPSPKSSPFCYPLKKKTTVGACSRVVCKGVEVGEKVVRLNRPFQKILLPLYWTMNLIYYPIGEFVLRFFFFAPL
jgi:hypothetical protein